MSETVAQQVLERVEALMRDEGVRTRAEAIRRVAAEMDRSISATSSAYYSARREAEAAAEPAPARPASTTAGPRQARAERARLYADMLPLVEAGATIEQAARRFGDDEEADEIASGFARWLLDERGRDTTDDVAEARRRIAALEAEVRGLRRDLARANQALARVRVIAADATGEPLDA